MKRRNLFAVAVLAVIIQASVATAHVHVTLHHPTPPYDVERLWWVDVYNDSTETVTGRMKGEITESGSSKVLFWAVTRAEALSAKQRKTFRYQNTIIDSSDYDPSLREFALRTGGLPGGKEYRFSVWWYPNGDTSRPDPFVPRQMGPPRLISPPDGDTIRAPYSQFVWTPPAGPTRPLSYTLGLKELLPNQGLVEAWGSNPSFHTIRGIQTTAQAWPMSAPALGAGQRYAWQVMAITADGETAKSELRSFTRATAETSSTCEIDSILMDSVLVPFSTEVVIGSDQRPHTFRFFGHCTGSGRVGISEYAYSVYYCCASEASGRTPGNNAKSGSSAFQQAFKDKEPRGGVFMVVVKLKCGDGTRSRRIYVRL
jgi:hypothetical protein